ERLLGRAQRPEDRATDLASSVPFARHASADVRPAFRPPDPGERFRLALDPPRDLDGRPRRVGRGFDEQVGQRLRPSDSSVSTGLPISLRVPDPDVRGERPGVAPEEPLELTPPL